MIAIEQAIYGEAPGKTMGHDLLAASGQKSELFRHVSGITDLADRPQGGVLTKPVVRGIFAEDHFLLIKTFPDHSPQVRSGRVFAHVLFIQKRDLHKIANISNLFRFHLSSVHKEAEMTSLEVDFFISREKSDKVIGREAVATNVLLQKENFAWLGEKGYWEWIDRIWTQLPLEEKCSIRIGAAFNPSYIKDEKLNIIYIPHEAKSLWERHGFRMLDVGESETLKSVAGHWLLNNTKESAHFQILIDDFALKINSIDFLNRLSNNGNVYFRLDQNPELNRLWVFSHFISQVNPDEKSGTKGKSKLLDAILRAIPTATSDQIKAFSYQSWRGFSGAEESSSVALSQWLSQNLMCSKNAEQGGSILVHALNNHSSSWWAKTVLKHVKGRLQKRQKTDASIVWQWMINEPELINRHSTWVPNDIEDELSKKLPKLQTNTAETVLWMAAQKGWLFLHANVVIQKYSAAEAIEAQLQVDTQGQHTKALEVLSNSIGDTAFVPIAAYYSDPRLHRIAGKMIARNSKLLQGVNIASEGWQCCWEVAIKEGGEVWSGIQNPQETLFKILDYLLNGNQFSEILLNAISDSSYSSLKSLPERLSIWNLLPSNARDNFIQATILDLIDELLAGKIRVVDLEYDLRNGFRKQEIQQKIISSAVISLTKKIRLFYILPGLEIYHAQQLIKHYRYTKAEAEEFGQLVSEMEWKQVANDLYDLHFSRKDLVVALSRCSNLLGLWKRLNLYTSGIKCDPISKEEWWNEFLKISIKLFPGGPEQDGLWISADGDLSQLNLNGTGREKWNLAVQIIRNHEPRKIKKLIEKMREIYSHNETLKNLYNTL